MTMINRKSLIQALTLAAKIAPKRSVIPILQYVRLSYSDGLLHIQTTDCDQHFKIVIPSSYCLSAPICVPIKDTLAIVKSSKDEFVTIEYHSGAMVTIDNAALPGLPASDFPEDNNWRTDGGSITLSNADWIKFIEAILPVTSKDDTRYYLQGAMIGTRAQGEVSFVATDGRRLALQTVDCVNDIKRDEIIPSYALESIVRILGFETPRDKTVMQYVSHDSGSRAIRITTDSVCYTSRVIDGSFPDYTRVIPVPDAEAHFVIAPLASIHDTAKSLIGLLPTKDSAIVLETNLGNVTLATPNAATVQMTKSLPSASQGGNNVTIGFRASYLVDLAKTFPKGSALTIEMQNALSPALITSGNAPGLSYVLMPVRI